jgi:hypothetical protein
MIAVLLIVACVHSQLVLEIATQLNQDTFLPMVTASIQTVPGNYTYYIDNNKPNDQVYLN